MLAAVVEPWLGRAAGAPEEIGVHVHDGCIGTIF